MVLRYTHLTKPDVSATQEVCKRLRQGTTWFLNARRVLTLPRCSRQLHVLVRQRLASDCTKLCEFAASRHLLHASVVTD